MRYDHFTMLPEGAFQRVGRRMSLYGGGKGSSPPPPDYRGAAQETAAANKEALNIQTWANRPTVNTPWGTQTWNTSKTTDPGTGQEVTAWEQKFNLTPEAQNSLSAQQRITDTRSGAAEKLAGQATAAFDTPFNWAGAPKAGSFEASGYNPQGARDNAQNALFQRQMSMIEPQLSQQEDARRTRLANMGIPIEGDSEAWRRAQMSMDSNRQRAVQDAAYQAVIGGGQEAQRELGIATGTAGEMDRQRQRYIAEEAQRRGIPLNEMNALLTGQQVTMPQMPQTPSSTAGNAGGTNYLGAAQALGQYNQNAAQLDAQANAGLWGGVGQLAGTGAMLYTMSDARLKRNIVRVGTHARGVGIYEYDIMGRRERGVLAQEVMTVAPHLVAPSKSGYLMVNYGGL